MQENEGSLHIVITGVGRGIGRAMAIAALARGIVDIAGTLDMARTGHFLRWTGEERGF